MGSSLVLNRRPKVPAEDTAAFGAIAERFRRAGALEQAVSLCRDGLKKFPDHVSARVTLGWSLLDLGKYDEARVELEQVMRRAPDNLAAIRGLAELHDRFEHTLNLPMDGPGQWPPPAESVDGEAAPDFASPYGAADATVSEQFEAELHLQAEPGISEPALAPAAMGLPLWTPAPASSPVAEAASASVTPTSSGMGRVREVDAFAGAPVPAAAARVVVTPEGAAPQTQTAPQTYQAENDQFEIDAPVVAIAAHAGVIETEAVEIDFEFDVKPDVAPELARDFTPDVTPVLTETGDELGVTLDVSNDALAALIAEAESLDAAAALEVVSSPDTLELGSVEVELASAEPVAEPVVHAVAEAVAEPFLESAVEPVLESAPEPVLESALEPAIEIDIESILEPEVAAQVAEVIAFAPRPADAVESVDVAPMASVVQAIAESSKSAAKVEALERMLRRVQARRRHLMTESVA